MDTAYFQMEQEKVTIIVPVYNTRRYVKQCIESIRAQTYRNLEIIAIDDGSTDGSGDVLDELSLCDSRLKVVHTENKGYSEARNLGLDYASGDYVGFVDSDDWISENLIETQVATIRNKEADISVCRVSAAYVDKITDTNVPIEVPFIDQSIDKEQLTLSIDKWRSFPYSGGHCVKKLGKKSVFEKARFIKDQSYCEDELFTLEIYLRAKKIAFNGDGVYYYRMRKSSVTHDEVGFLFKLMRGRFLMRESGLITDDFFLLKSSLRFSALLITAKTHTDSDERIRLKVLDLYSKNISLWPKFISLDIKTTLYFALMAIVVFPWAPVRMRHEVFKMIQRFLPAGCLSGSNNDAGVFD